MDAAMGTRLIGQGLQLQQDDPCLWNLKRPEAVLAIHKNDIEAGADVLLTNTFGANRASLARYDRGAWVGKIIEIAVRLARQAAGPTRFVIGSMGPSALQNPTAYREQAELLLDAGVDALLLETHSEEGASRCGLPTLRGLTDRPILVSLVETSQLSGPSAHRMVELGASALGSNCQLGMQPMVLMAERMHGWGLDVPLLVKPSASLAGSQPVSPATFAEAVPLLIERGVRLVGGCCGSTEAHVGALRAALDALASLSD
jgi:methionine synthase I (cobalamin-dependent)